MITEHDYIIDDSSPTSAAAAPQGMGKGYEERDYRLFPKEMFATPSQIQILSDDEIRSRITRQETDKSSLTHLVRKGNFGSSIPATNQGSEGYCWAYSQVSCVHAARARDNLPYVALSGHSIGCMVKNFRNQGGWCGESARFAEKNGVATQADWPQQSMSHSNNNSTTWEHAKAFIISDHVIDLTKEAWDDTLTFRCVLSLLVSNIPVQGDFNWWSHSVGLLRALDGVGAYNASELRATTGKLLTMQEFERRWNVAMTGGFGVEIWNSWGNSWGNEGTGVLAGSKAIPDGAVATLWAPPTANPNQ